MLRARLAVLEGMRASVDPEQLPEAAAAIVADYWEKVGNLVKSGHVDHGQLIANACRVWWARLRPFALMGRSRFDDHEIYMHFEWLAGVFAEEDRRAGVKQVYDDAYLARTLGSSIQAAIDGIRLAEELRAVIVRPVPPATSPVAVSGEGSLPTSTAPPAEPA